MTTAASDSLKRAASFYGQGNLVAARTQAEAAVATEPDNAAALQFLGVICCQAGDVAHGTDYLRRALQHQPGDTQLRLNLARALMDLEEFDAGLEVCSSGPSSGPASADLWRMKGDIFKAQGKPEESVTAYGRAVEADQRNFEAWNNLGNARLDAGDTPGAIEALERARSLSPGSSLIRLNLGRALVAAERLTDAVTELEVAARIAPQDTAVLLELGRTLDRAGRSQEAILPLASAARLDRANPAVFVALGLAFAALGEFDRAEESYRFALSADPGHPAALLNLGVLLEQSNRVEQLDQLIESGVARGVTGDEIDCLRALSLRRQGRFREALDLVLPIRSPAIDPRMRAQLEAQLADRLGEVDIAFAAYTEMNTAMTRDRAIEPFDGTEHRLFVEELARLTTPEWFESWPAVVVDSSPPAPAFLVGFPRSGTTLLDTVLMGHPRTHVLEEQPMLGRVLDRVGGIAGIPALDAVQVNACRRRYFEELDAIDPAPQGRLVIDKMPLSVLRLALIHRLFPDARIIFAQRHPCDVVLSCFMQNFKINQAMASFLNMRNSALLYDRVLGYWRQCREVFPLRTHIVRYEGMVADLEAEVRPLIDFLSLQWDDKLLDHQGTAVERGYIRTPSYSQVTERIYARAQGRWERYRGHMREILPILAPWVERLGYEPLEGDAVAEETTA